MDSHAFQEFQSELTCSICMNYFLDPITIDCGHSFCRPCLCLCWEEAHTPMCCPECRTVTEKTDFRASIILRKLVSITRQVRPCPDSGSGEQICTAHRETKGLFCHVDKNLLCAPCSESPEHAAHSHSPVSWAAEEYRENLLKKMDPLWKMAQEMQDNLNEEVSKSQSFMEYVTLRKNMIQVQYQMMHQFLFEEEQFQLVTLGREAEEIFQQLRESELRMTQHRERLKEMYRELIEMCHKPDMELLQDSKDIFERIELVQRQKPISVNLELPSLKITGILDMLNHFKVNNGMIQGWSNPCTSLSEEVRNMIFGDDGATEDPQSVESFAAWGVEAFTSGRHYWEVDVPKASNWVLGVCNDSMTSDTLEGEKAFLLVSLKKNNHCSLSTNYPAVTHFVQRPQGRVGVFLDCDNANMSFYDVCQGSLICSFFSSSFTSPLKPFLCLGY